MKVGEDKGKVRRRSRKPRREVSSERQLQPAQQELITQSPNTRSKYLLCQFWKHNTRRRGAQFQTELLRGRSWYWVWNWDRYLLILRRSNEPRQDLPKVNENKRYRKWSSTLKSNLIRTFVLEHRRHPFFSPTVKGISQIFLHSFRDDHTFLAFVD